LATAATTDGNGFVAFFAAFFFGEFFEEFFGALFDALLAALLPAPLLVPLLLVEAGFLVFLDADFARGNVSLSEGAVV
jgi:hypothetical protein